MRLLVVVALGFLCGKLASKLRMPAVLGFLIAGMALGPNAANLLTQEILDAPAYENLISVLECGMGLMLGIDVKGPRTNKELAALLIDHGLLCLTAGDRLRLLPPLVITKEEMDEGLAILKQTLMG